MTFSVSRPISMSMNKPAVEAYKQWQQALAQYGATGYAADRFYELCRHIEADPCLDVEGFELVLERLHRAAFP